MDRLSRALIGAICALICVSAAVVYTTWIWEKPEIAVSSPAQIGEEMELAVIAMNTEAQVINGGGQDMWIRAEVELPQKKIEVTDGATDRGAEGCWQFVSNTIIENPSPQERKRGVWIPGEDGYYYYSTPVCPGEQSRPLFQSIRAAVDSKGTHNVNVESAASQDPMDQRIQTESVKVRAEGIQVNWVSSDAETCQEAYRLFELYQPLWDERAEFV